MWCAAHARTFIMLLPCFSPSSHHNDTIKIVYSIDALQSLIEEEKQEALTQLGEHYRNQLQSLQEHIADQQKKWAEIERMVCKSMCEYTNCNYYVSFSTER